MLRFLALLLVALPTLAVDNPYGSEFIGGDAEPDAPSSVKDPEFWKEGQYRLPPWPRDADLVEFELDGPPTSFRYFIDMKNLVTGRDGVMRYTLVLRSNRGAENVFFEGMRCTAAGQVRTLANGIQGRFEPVKSDWQRLDSALAHRYHRELFSALCAPAGEKPRPRRDQIRALKGSIGEQENRGFWAD